MVTTNADYAAPMPGHQAASRDPSDRWRSLVGALAPPRLADLQVSLLERFIDQFGITPRPPATGSRPYLNLYPPRGFGSARIGNLAITSSRFYAIPDPMRLELHLTVVPEGEPAEGKYLTRYVGSREDIEIAARLLQCAFDDRPVGRGTERQRGPRAAEPTGRRNLQDADSTPQSDSDLMRAEPVHIPEEHRATARRIVESPAYRARLGAMPRGAPGDGRAVEALALLLASGGVAGFGSISHVTEIATPRVSGFLSRLEVLLSVDGIKLLTVDTAAQEARVQPALLVSQFGV